MPQTNIPRYFIHFPPASIEFFYFLCFLVNFSAFYLSLSLFSLQNTCYYSFELLVFVSVSFSCSNCSCLFCSSFSSVVFFFVFFQFLSFCCFRQFWVLGFGHISQNLNFLCFCVNLVDFGIWVLVKILNRVLGSAL